MKTHESWSRIAEKSIENQSNIYGRKTLMENLKIDRRSIEKWMEKIAMMERIKTNDNSSRIVEKSMQNPSKIYGRIAIDGAYTKQWKIDRKSIEKWMEKIAMMERKKSNENSAGIDEKSMENQSKVYGRIANDGTYRK